MKKKLIIYGYNARNLGDDLMFAEVINKTNYDSYYFIGVGPIPHFINKPINFIRRGRLMAFRWKLASDFAIIGGSVLMGSSDTQESMIREKIKWFRFNKLLGGRNFIVGANLGPYLDESRYLSLLKKMVQVTDKWFVRDQFSFDLLSKIQTKFLKLMPDLVMGFDTSLYKSKTKKQVAISPTSVAKDGSDISQDDFNQEIVFLVNKYVEQGYDVSFISFEDRFDLPIVNDILGLLDKSVILHIKVVNNDGQNIVEEISRSEILVSTRFHCMVLGALFEKQQIIYSYSQKTNQFANLYGFETFEISGVAQHKTPTLTKFQQQPLEMVKPYAELIQR